MTEQNTLFTVSKKTPQLWPTRDEKNYQQTDQQNIKNDKYYRN